MTDVLKFYYPWSLNHILVLNLPPAIEWIYENTIKKFLPESAVKRIKIVNNSTIDEFVTPDQKLCVWGGKDAWKYKFIEETVQYKGK